jgi:moderate conductance mechanosensitive channel
MPTVLATLVAQVAPVTTTTTNPVTQACGPDHDPWLCRWFADATNSTQAGDVGRILSPWVSIILIVLGAWVVNRLLRRLIRRAVLGWETAGRFTWVRRRRMFALLEKTGPTTPDIRRHQRAETLAGGIRSFASIIVWTVAIVFILAVLGIEASTLLTSAGLIGVALGFGAQNLLRDLIAGTFMIFEDQIGVGDVIDAGVAIGTVEAVTLRTTKLRDVEGVVWYVPNGEMHRVGNKTQQWSRAVLDIPIAYDADIDRAQQVIKQSAVAMSQDERWRERILSEPEVWGVESLALDSVVIRLVVKTAPLEQWSVGRELRRQIKQALDAAGIASPKPPTAAADNGPRSPGHAAG